jgi:hypothetical protein
MKTPERFNMMGTLSMAALVNAVVMVLCVGFFTWILGTYTWPNVVHPLGMLVDGNLLVGGVLAAAVLIGKEFCGISSWLTLPVNALVIVASLAYLALYVSVNVAGLLIYASGAAGMG